jgi:hypothetical protein
MDADDVRMPQLGSRPRLAQELLGLLGLQFTLARDLHGDCPLKLLVARLPDGAEGTHANLFDQLKVPDGPPVGRSVRDRAFPDQAEMAATGWAGQRAEIALLGKLKRFMTMQTTDFHPMPLQGGLFCSSSAFGRQ